MDFSWREVLQTYVLGEDYLPTWLIFVAVAGFVIWMKVRQARIKQRILRNLRRLPREQHSEEIARFLDYHFREWLRSSIATEFLLPGEPPVDCFLFSSHARALNQWALWVLVGASLVAAAGVFMVQRRTPAQLAAIVAFTTLSGCAWWLRRRAAYLDSVLEISPFAIREVHASGLRRTLFWKDAGWLINRRWLGRVDVATPNGRERIHVHYERLEFYKALQLIIKYGGFNPAPPPPN